MKATRSKFLLAILVCVLLSMTAVPAIASKTPQHRIDGAISILREMSRQEDAGSMANLLKRAKGVAIFPSVIKAGFIFGGKYGEGLVLKRDASTGRWYGPSFVNVTGGSWGLQIGVQSIALVLVITNERGMEGFRGSNVKLGGDLSVAAGPVGRRGEMGTDINLKSSIYSYSMSKGFFAGMSLEGAVLNPDENANQSYWRTAIAPASALKRRATDKRITRLTSELNRLIKSAR